ncbi:MAG TPA: hypothetical protein VHU79_01770 [Sphingomicrobium sp.]|nr:hypothetical protein [Sphingomicrobium sp.]
MSEVAVDAGGGDVTPAPKRIGRPHFDAIVSIAAIFISAVALCRNRTRQDRARAKIV